MQNFDTNANKISRFATTTKSSGSTMRQLMRVICIKKVHQFGLVLIGLSL